MGIVAGDDAYGRGGAKIFADEVKMLIYVTQVGSTLSQDVKYIFFRCSFRSINWVLVLPLMKSFLRTRRRLKFHQSLPASVHLEFMSFSCLLWNKMLQHFLTKWSGMMPGILN